MKLDSQKRFLYHITTKDWSNKVRLSPLSTGAHRQRSEPIVARICVSDNVSGCVVAIYPCLDIISPIRVYRTARRIQATLPYEVFDSEATREKWIVQNVDMVFIGILNKSVIPYSLTLLVPGDDCYDTLREQKKHYTRLRKLEISGKLVHTK